MKKVKKEIKSRNKNLTTLSIFVLIASFLIGYNFPLAVSNSFTGAASVTDIGAKYLGDGSEQPSTSNTYGTIKVMPSGLTQIDKLQTGFNHKIDNIPTAIIWTQSGKYYETIDGTKWISGYLKKPDGTIIKPVTGYSHNVNGHWVILWDKDGNYYATQGLDYNNDKIKDWKTSTKDWKTGTLVVNNNKIYPTLGYRHNIGGEWAVVWQSNNYYATKDTVDWKTGSMTTLFGNFVKNKNQVPIAEYSHNIGGGWVILFTSDGRFYSTNDAQNWNSGTITNYYGSPYSSSSNYNPNRGNIVAPSIGFSHNIGGLEEVVLILTSGDLYTTKDARFWTFVDYDTGKVWYGSWR